MSASAAIRQSGDQGQHLPVYTYKAIGRDGQSLSGSLSADSPAAGRQSLRQLGVTLTEFAPAQLATRSRAGLPIGRGRRRDRLTDFARQLSMLVRAGVPLAEALEVLIRQEAGRFGAVLRDIRDSVRAGSRLSDALAAHPEWFDRVFCTAVRVGQSSGQMDTCLNDLAEYMSERRTLAGRLQAALAYPAILTVVGLGVVLFLMTFVVPQLLQVLEASGRPLPLATVVLKRFSDFLVAHWVMLVALGGAVVSGWCVALRWKRVRRWLHGMQLSMPLAGTLIRKNLIAQFAQMMSLLLRNGIPFLESIRLAKETTPQVVLEEELAQVEQAVERGSDIAPALADSRVFPPLVVHIFNVGQEAGELTDMLTQLRESYATEVRLAITKFTTVLEPLLIVLMSVAVGYVVFATMMPILEITKSMQ